MAWLESHQGLARHTKTKRFARKLGVKIPTAVGHLHLLWWWAMDNIEDGNLSIVEPEDIADEMMYEGDPGQLITSLVESGFVDVVDEKLFIHDWHDYIGRLLERRKQDTERKRRNRGKDKAVTGMSRGTDEGLSEDGARNSTVQYLTNNITLLGTNFDKVTKAYAEIHGVIDMPFSDSPLLTKMLEDGVKPDFIIGIMKEKYKPSVKTLKFYEGAIRESLERAASNKSRGFNEQASKVIKRSEWEEEERLAAEQAEKGRSSWI